MNLNEDEEFSPDGSSESDASLSLSNMDDSSDTSSSSCLGPEYEFAVEDEDPATVKAKVVYIVVLGDIGRSPRMCYHALSFAKENCWVKIIGYGGSELPESIASNPNIWVSVMKEPPEVLQKLPKLIQYPLKVVWQWLFLSLVFFWSAFTQHFIPDFILVQNPPAVPTLGLCWAYSKIFRCPLIIDWHNYGYSIMSLKTSRKNPMVRFAKWFEDYFGSKGNFHLCVTKAMQADLKSRLGICAITLYDRPPDIFQSITEETRKQFLLSLSDKYPLLEEAAATQELGFGRPGILISSTSWTEDEDFRILLFALQDYEDAYNEWPGKFPKLVVFITGKGPQKEHYAEIIKNLNLKHVSIYLPWMTHEEYPLLLASSDLGVSLHTSSSGLDLPMKVVDMFGAGLPVCAMGFNCISELVHNDENGYIFNSSSELAEQIQAWFRLKDPGQVDMTKVLRKNIKKFQALRWHENWKHHVIPIIESTSDERLE